MPGLGDDYNGDNVDELDLTVHVTNVDEPGSVVISPLQPQVGTLLTAILTDEDNTAPGQGVWQWAKSDSMNVPFTNIPERSGDRTYRPVEADLNQYLQVTVEYKDRSGPKTQTVQQVSAYPVRRDTSTSNDPPKFPDQKTLSGGNAIVRTATERFILENSPERTRVGAPVTAFDDATDIEVLTYSLSDTRGWK